MMVCLIFVRVIFFLRNFRSLRIFDDNSEKIINYINLFKISYNFIIAPPVEIPPEQSKFDEVIGIFLGINVVGSIFIFPFLLFDHWSFKVLFSESLWLASIYHFLYNLCSFLLISQVSPLTHTLGNVMKRSFVIIVSIIAGNYPIYRNTVIGIVMSVGGSCYYGYLKSKKVTDKNHSGFMLGFTVVTIILSCIGYKTLPTVIYHSPTSSQSFFTIWTRGEQQFPFRLEQNLENLLSHHPMATVTLYASYIEGQEPLIDLQERYPLQVNVVQLDVREILGGTLLEQWGKHHMTWKWKFLQNFDYHLVDALKLALLWKYGGAYFDSDLVLLKPISQTGNFLSMYDYAIDSKLMSFSINNDFVKKLMKVFSDSYTPYSRTVNNRIDFDAIWKDSCVKKIDHGICKEISIVHINGHVLFDYEDYFNFEKFAQDEHELLIESLSEEDTLAIDINYRKTAHITIEADSFIYKILTMNTFNIVPDFEKSVNLDKFMKFASYSYTTKNIGDEMQSLANIQYLPRIDYFLDRDNITQYSSYPNITLIGNGWYTYNKEWNIPDNIDPIFVAFHGNSKFIYEKAQQLLKRYEPIGCRDFYTRDKLEEAGVKAYFTGCLTTTIKNPYLGQPRENKIYIVNSLLTHLLPKSVRNKAIYFSHLTNANNTFEKLELANQAMLKYSRAKLTITSRIHSAFPSVGVRTPVIFMRYNTTVYNNKYHTDPR